MRSFIGGLHSTEEIHSHNWSFWLLIIAWTQWHNQFNLIICQDASGPLWIENLFSCNICSFSLSARNYSVKWENCFSFSAKKIKSLRWPKYKMNDWLRQVNTFLHVIDYNLKCMGELASFFPPIAGNWVKPYGCATCAAAWGALPLSSTGGAVATNGKAAQGLHTTLPLSRLTHSVAPYPLYTSIRSGFTHSFHRSCAL